MTTVIDRKLKPKITAAIKRVARTVQASAGGGTYNPATGTVTGTPAYQAVKMTPPTPASFELTRNGMAKDGDTEVYFDAATIAFRPLLGMLVQFDGQTWYAVRVDDVYTGDDVGVYHVVLRRT